MAVPVLGVATFAVAPVVQLSGCRKNVSEHGPSDRLACSMFILALTGVVVRRHRSAALLVPLEVRRGEGRRAPATYIHGSHTLEVVWTIIPGCNAPFSRDLPDECTWADVKMRRPRHVTDGGGCWTGSLNGGSAIRAATICSAPRDDLFLDQRSAPAGRRGHPHSVEEHGRAALASFLPNFRIKQDAVPGMKIPVWFKATRDRSVRHRVRRTLRLGPL